MDHQIIFASVIQYVPKFERVILKTIRMKAIRISLEKISYLHPLRILNVNDKQLHPLIRASTF